MVIAFFGRKKRKKWFFRLKQNIKKDSIVKRNLKREALQETPHPPPLPEKKAPNLSCKHPSNKKPSCFKLFLLSTQPYDIEMQNSF